MEIWFLLALGSAVSSSVAHISDKVLTKYIHPQLLPAIKKAINGTMLLTFSFLVFRIYFPLSGTFWIFILLLVSLDLVSTVLYFIGIREEEVSKLMPFQTSLIVVLPFLLGVLLLSETVSLLNGLSVLLMGIGAYIVVSDGRFGVPRKSTALKLITLAAVFWSFYGITAKVAVGSFPPYLLAVIVYYTGSPILWGYNLGKNRQELKKLKDVFTPRLIGVLIVACAGASSASLLSYFALKLGKASLVLPVTHTSPLFTVVLSGRILREKKTGIRLLGAFLTVLGILGIYLL